MIKQIGNKTLHRQGIFSLSVIESKRTLFHYITLFVVTTFPSVTMSLFKIIKTLILWAIVTNRVDAVPKLPCYDDWSALKQYIE